MTSCRARTAREGDGLSVWEPIKSGLRRERMSCKKFEATKPRAKKRLKKTKISEGEQRRDRGEMGKGGAAVETNTHRLQSPSQQHLGSSRSTPTNRSSYHCTCMYAALTRQWTNHDCIAYVQFMLIAFNTTELMHRI